ncbi:MAG: histidine phosphatase family protein, partial [Xanthomonadales bacterium]|nr:histidine phosphatase family protein [Xanthomonadales bacterium]
MKHLIILRHAKSNWSDLSLSDHDRSLNQRGKNSAPIMGQRLSKKPIQPQLVLCSTAVRAKATAKKVLD